MDAMTPESWIVVGTIAGALVLFASERIRPDVVALLVPVTLSLTGGYTYDNNVRIVCRLKTDSKTTLHVDDPIADPARPQIA